MAPLREPPANTPHLLSQAFMRLSDRIVPTLNAAGHPLRRAHQAVFVNLDQAGTRLSQLAERAGMTPQAMGELVDDLERLGYLTRVPDPTDRRAKLIVATDTGYEAIQLALDTIARIEEDLEQLLGTRRLRELRGALRRIVAEM